MREYGDGGISGAIVFATSEANRRDPRGLYSLFRGEPDALNGRFVAMTNLRRPGDILCAKPFREHGLDYRLLPDGGGGVTEALGPDGLIVSFEQEAAGAPLLVYGFVADHVVAVDVVVAGRSIPARLENNGYAVLVEADADDFESVVVHRSDGTSERI